MPDRRPTPPLFPDVTRADYPPRRRGPTATPHLPFKGLRKNGFGGVRTQAQDADFVRDVLIGRLDGLLDTVEATLRRHGAFEDGLGLAVIQDLQIVFFPEEFLEPADKPHAGLVPRGGGPTATAAGWAALAARLRGQAGAEEQARARP